MAYSKPKHRISEPTTAERRARLHRLDRHTRPIEFHGGAVYILLCEDEPVYVGRTESLGLRYDRLCRSVPPRSTDAGRAYDGEPGGWFDYALFIPTPPLWLTMREAALIAWLAPRYNARVLLDAHRRRHLRDTLGIHVV